MHGTAPFCPRAPAAAHRPHTAQTVLVRDQQTTARQQDFPQPPAARLETEEQEGTTSYCYIPQKETAAMPTEMGTRLGEPVHTPQVR